MSKGFFILLELTIQCYLSCTASAFPSEPFDGRAQPVRKNVQHLQEPLTNSALLEKYSNEPAEQQKSHEGTHKSPTEIVSDIFSDFRKLFTKNRDFMCLPDIEKAFFDGKFVAKSGYFRSFSSLEFNGTLQFQKGRGLIAVIAPSKFQIFEAGYNKYSLVIGNSSYSGSVRMSAASNGMKVVFQLRQQGTYCAYFLQDVSFQEISGIKFVVEGLDTYKDLVEILTEWLIGSFESEFRRLVSQEVKNKLTLVLPKYCSF